MGTVEHLQPQVDEIVRILLRGENVFLSGIFGSGYHRIARCVKEELRNKGFEVFDGEIFVENDSWHKRIPKEGRSFLVFVDNCYLKENRSTLLTLFNLYRDNLSILTTIDLLDILKKSSFALRNLSGIIVCSKLLNFEQIVSLINSRREKYRWNVDKKYFKRIFELSNGHAGIAKRLCHYIHLFGEIPENRAGIFNFQPLWIKFKRLEEELSLVEADSSGYDFIKRQIGSIPLMLEYLDSHIELSVTEQELLAFFLQNSGKIMSLEQIHLALGKDYADFSMWRVYKILERLKKKVKDKYELINIKGKGYKLVPI